MCVCKQEGNCCQEIFIGKSLICKQSVFLCLILNKEMNLRTITNGSITWHDKLRIGTKYLKQLLLTPRSRECLKSHKLVGKWLPSVAMYLY